MKLENEYENGEINVKEYVMEENIHRYWLRVGGVSLLELKEHHMYELYDLLQAWVGENANCASQEQPQFSDDDLGYFYNYDKRELKND